MVLSLEATYPPAEAQEMTHNSESSVCRRHACEACRTMKVRCRYTLHNSEPQQCQRCSRTNQKCVFEARTNNTRRRRTDVRMEDLEKRIEVLASIWNRRTSSSPGTVSINTNTEQTTSQKEDYQSNPWIMMRESGPGRSNTEPTTMNIDQHGHPGTKAIQAHSKSTAPVLPKDRKLADHSISTVSAPKGPNYWRRPHTKSRTGCKPCKKRKIKCDETKPACSRCISQKICCDYPSLTSAPEELQKSDTATLWSTASTSSMSTSLITSQLENLLTGKHDELFSPVQSASRSIGLLEVLSHFESVAFSTIGAPHIQNAMRRHGLLLALEAPFLLHAILAYSFQHLQHLQPIQQDYKRSATYYGRRGLQLYSKELDLSITQHNMDAVFATCMVFAILAYTTDDVSPERSFVFSDDPGAISWLSVQFGFLTLKRTQKIQPYLGNSIWSPLFQESDEQGLLYDTRTGTDGLPTSFVELCGIDESSTDDNNAYHAALRLCMSIMHIEVNIQAFTKFISFPGRMRPEFYNLVRRKDPVALLILSYWLSRMCDVEQWWCIPRVKSESLAICAYLERSPDMRIRRLLDIPMQACGYGLYKARKAARTV